MRTGFWLVTTMLLCFMTSASSFGSMIGGGGPDPRPEIKELDKNLNEKIKDLNRNVLEFRTSVETLSQSSAEYSNKMNKNLLEVNDSIRALNKSVLEFKTSVEALSQSSTEYSTKMYNLTWVIVILTFVMVVDVVFRLRSMFKKLPQEKDDGKRESPTKDPIDIPPSTAST